MKQPCIYIVTNKRNGTLYTDVTSNLFERGYSHSQSRGSDFTSKYSCKILVYYETYTNMTDAIAREKQIKGGSRKDKLKLIETLNPQWRDLYLDLA